jgi:SPP1 gp7 family putative phage head morphogenesis protein
MEFIVKVKPITANARRGRWATNPQKVKQFNEWLKTQVDAGILEQSHEPWTVKYTKRAYNKGYSRTYNEVRRKTVNDPKKRAAGLEELMRRQQDVGGGKLQILASRAYEDLKGVTSQMSSQISRELVNGVLNGDGPEAIAQAIAKRVDMGLSRARMIARTEIAHAHAESQLDALEDMGLEDVGIMVEWINGVNPCPRCAKMLGKVMKIKTARGKIPVHPNCMCAFVPVETD